MVDYFLLFKIILPKLGLISAWMSASVPAVDGAYLCSLYAEFFSRNEDTPFFIAKGDCLQVIEVDFGSSS